MAKSRSAYVCQSCGASAPKWLGKCPSCQQWNTFVEERVVESPRASRTVSASRAAAPVPLAQVKHEGEPRIDTGSGEVNRLLGGGLVPGSLILLGGEPGIGKSTLSLQLALSMRGKTLYVSGEESARQVKMRADRLTVGDGECLILNETIVESILQHAEAVAPDLLLVDSVQTLSSENLESTPGSVSQVRECAAALLRYAKTTGVPAILIGHITKEGSLAGPKVLEHIVDVVLQFEGDQSHMYRLLRGVKNRFGATSELAIFEMTGVGLREVTNPSELLLSHRAEPLPGVAVSAAMDGTRPMLVEVQALVSQSVYGVPQRSCTGFDPRRLNMLLAVLERHAGFKLGGKDVFLNVAGGLRLSDPAADMAVVAAVLSSYYDTPYPTGVCFCAEVGLSGEVRQVARLPQRVREAVRQGFKALFVASHGLERAGIESEASALRPVDSVQELVKRILSGKS